jgi:hypothetical protein
MILWEASLTPMNYYNSRSPIGLGEASYSSFAARSSLVGSGNSEPL